MTLRITKYTLTQSETSDIQSSPSCTFVTLKKPKTNKMKVISLVKVKSTSLFFFSLSFQFVFLVLIFGFILFFKDCSHSAITSWPVKCLCLTNAEVSALFYTYMPMQVQKKNCCNMFFFSCALQVAFS